MNGPTSPLIEWLRSMAPSRALHQDEAMRLAEQQATALLLTLAEPGPPIEKRSVESLEAIRTRLWRGLPVSGMAVAHQRSWEIVLDPNEPGTRQIETLLYELKHVIDHADSRLLYASGESGVDGALAERACERFAHSVLMPGAWLIRDWQNGLRGTSELARRYGVTKESMRLRLEEFGFSARDKQPKGGSKR